MSKLHNVGCSQWTLPLGAACSQQRLKKLIPSCRLKPLARWSGLPCMYEGKAPSRACSRDQLAAEGFRAEAEPSKRRKNLRRRVRHSESGPLLPAAVAQLGAACMVWASATTTDSSYPKLKISTTSSSCAVAAAFLAAAVCLCRCGCHGRCMVALSCCGLSLLFAISEGL